MSKQRQANIEALRVLAILGIVVQHYTGHGLNGFMAPYHVAEYGPEEFSDVLAWLCTQSAYALGQTGVNTFVLITGWFLGRRTTWRWRGMLGVSAQTVFYTTIIYCIAVAVGFAPFKWFDALDCLMPIPIEHHWFIRTYIPLLLAAPLLAFAVHKLSRRTYTFMLAVLLALHVRYVWGDTFSEGGRDLQWFLILFLTGNYLRRYRPRRLMAHAGTVLLIVLAVFVATSAAVSLVKGDYLLLHSPGNNTLVYVMSVLIFLCAVRTRPDAPWAAKLAKAAPYVLGVYLIHDDIWVRNMLWGHILPALGIYTHWGALALMALMCPAVFAACAIIDKCRSLLFRDLGIDAALDRLAFRIESKLNITLPEDGNNKP